MWRSGELPTAPTAARAGSPPTKAASAFAAARENDRARGVDFDPNAGKVLFRDAAAMWLASRADLKSATHNNHRYALAPAPTRRGDGKTLGIDAVFGGYPLNKINREYIQAWVNRLTETGKKPSTLRHAFFTVRMVLAQAVADGRLSANPADHVKLPTEHSTKGGKVGVVDDPAQFLTAAQVSALVDATPWPYNVVVHLAAWSGLRAAELAGLTVGDVTFPDPPLNPNAPGKPGQLRVERSARAFGAEMVYLPPKTKGSFRRVPLTAATAEMLRDYLAEHPRADEASAPLFPNATLTAPRPTGVRAWGSDGKPASQDRRAAKARQATALAELAVADVEKRLVLDWSEPLRHPTFYKAVYRPAVLRANRLTPTAKLSPELKFHSLRHTYASLCTAAGLKLG
jgi:integrase